MVADLQSSLLAGTSPKCCSVPRCSNPTATARPTKMHPATKTNSKFDDPGPISVSAPVVLLQMHRPSNLMVAIITRDRPRSQYANTDVSLRINSFQGGNRVGQHGHTHTHISRLPRPTTHSHGTPPTRRHRETSFVPFVLADGERPKMSIVRSENMSRGEAHPATKINSKFVAPRSFPMSVPVVLVQMHRPLHLKAIISPDIPRSQPANTDVSTGEVADHRELCTVYEV